MTTDTTQARAKEIFLAAIELASPDERRAFADAQCGADSLLHQEVDQLLAHHAAATGGFLTSPAAPLPQSPESLNPPLIFAAPGTIIGRYKLLEPIGEGGYGTVFMAEQTSPVHRKVALKIIKAGMDTRQVIARFEAERQALALMDHPNIARVFDAGVTETGRPYFVMELVRGAPVTKYCDDHRLSPRQRLELFVQVCHAVQHAHQKGIIHRDLKPTNVLVAQYDGQPVPKVIDFGVAKAMGQQLTERTMFTGFGDVIGTPQYMSPEQAELNQLDVDTRSDIYSLGVLLYELLTGTTPLENKRVREAALLEVLRVIREEEPPKPSTRLSTADGLASIAAQRGLEPRHLARTVHGELDWIVMKALEKERSRRYETANGLARDVERYLHDEPVLACPPSAPYRFRKFARRNKAALTMAAVVVGFVFAGLVLLALNNVRLKAEQARTRAESQRAQAELSRADGNLGVALQSLDEVYLRQIETRGYQRRELSPADRELLQKGLDFYRQFSAHNSGQVALRQEVAKADRRLGQLWRELGQLHEAQAAFERAIPIFESLLVQSRDVPTYRRELATCLTGLSVVVRDLGHKHLAEEPSTRALGLWEAIVADPSCTRDDRLRFGHALWHQGWLDSTGGRQQETERHLTRALDVFEKLSAEVPAERGYRMETAVSHRWLSEYVCGPSGRIDEACQHYRKAIDLYQNLANETQDNDWYLREWQYTLRCFADLQTRAGRAQEAQELSRQAVEVQEKLTEPYRIAATRRPKDPWTHQALADVLAGQGRYAEAEAEFRQALRLESNDAGRHQNLADALRNQRKFADAAVEYAEAARLSSDPFASFYGLGSVCAYTGQWEKAAAAFERAAALRPADVWAAYRWATLCLYIKDEDRYRRACRVMLDRFGQTADPLTADRVAKLFAMKPKFGGEEEQVMALMDRAMRGSEKLKERIWVEVDNGLAEYRAGRFEAAAQAIAGAAPSDGDPQLRALAFSILAMAHERLSKLDEADAALMEAKRILSTKMPKTQVGETFNDDWHDWLLAELVCREAEELLIQTATTRNSPRASKLLAASQCDLGSRLLTEGKIADAVAAFDQAIRLQPDLVAAWASRGECRRRSGEFAKMIEDYSQAIKLRPSEQWYWHERAFAYLMLGEHEKAVADHSKSIELGDQDPAQRIRRGHSYQALQEFRKARADYDRAIALNPGLPGGWQARARLHHQQHEHEKARSDLAKAAELAGDADALNGMAWNLATDPDPSWRNPKLALELAERAIAARPGDGAIWNTVGAARYRDGQWQAAIAAFEKSMEVRDGGDAFDWFFLAMCHFRLGERDAARKWYDQAVEWTEKNQPKSTELRRFRTEAAELLKIPGTQPATQGVK